MATLQRNRQDWTEREKEENRTRLGDSLSMEFDLEWERALLTCDDTKLQLAFAEWQEEVNARGGFPDDDEGPQAWIAIAFATVGDAEKASFWREEHRKIHSATGEENSPFGRISDAFADAVAGGDPDEGIAAIQKVTKEIGCASNGCWSNLIGELEESRGNIEAAIGYYEHAVDGYRMFKMQQDEGLIAIYNFRLGDLNERLGNDDEAIRRYSYMAERWKGADAVLQPQVAEAHRRVESLLDRKAREQN